MAWIGRIKGTKLVANSRNVNAGIAVVGYKNRVTGKLELAVLREVEVYA